MTHLDQDLYLQVLQFHDIVASRQPSWRAYLQDGFEMAITGVMEGVKFNLSRTTDAGPVYQIDGWDLKAYRLDQASSPLALKVLDNAAEAAERHVQSDRTRSDCRAGIIRTERKEKICP